MAVVTGAATTICRCPYAKDRWRYRRVSETVGKQICELLTRVTVAQGR